MRKHKKMSLITPVLLAAIAIFFAGKSARAADSDLIITEVMYNPAGADDKYEWIELYNPSDEPVPLNKDTFRISDSSGVCHKINNSVELAAEAFAIIADDRDAFLEIYKNYPNESSVIDSSFDLKDNDTLKLSFDKCAHWQSEFSYSSDWGGKDNGKTLEKINPRGENGKENWQESCETGGTPGSEPQMCETEPDPPSGDTQGDDNAIGSPEEKNPVPDEPDENPEENLSSATSVVLNEILPNPEGGTDDEYIELVNTGKESVDLYKWLIRDGSKTGKYVFENHTKMKSGGYFTIRRPESKLALNNSDESVRLSNPRGKITSSVSYAKAPKGSSYNFDGKEWRWSRYLTPGTENKFDSAPVVKIEKPKNIYAGILAEFSAKAEDKETKMLKFAWDFGDGRKSYLEKTSHKYLETGKYTVMLAVTDESQTIEKSFQLEVKKYPRPNLEIVKIVPNPEGNDSESETMDITNNSRKKVDLLDWGVATGSGDNMYNHPISEKFEIGPGKTKTITREISAFSLNNKSGKIQLKTPVGKIVDEVEYSKEKIAEGEAYVKKDGGWTWLAPNIVEEGGASQEKNNIDVETTDEQGEVAGEILGATDENINPPENYNANFSSESAFIFLNRIGFGLPPAELNYCPMKDSPLSIAWLLVAMI